METVDGVLERLNQLLAEVERVIDHDGHGAGQSVGSASKPNAARPSQPDAIDRLLNAPRRTTSVVRLRGSEPFERFKQELVDGLIRVDAGHRLLDLLEAVLVYAGLRR